MTWRKGEEDEDRSWRAIELLNELARGVKSVIAKAGFGHRAESVAYLWEQRDAKAQGHSLTSQVRQSPQDLT